MAWTEIAREQYRRNGLRYASDMTEAEWGLISRNCRERAQVADPARTICEGYRSGPLHPVDGLPMASVAEEFPPYSTVQGHFYTWRDTGRWQRIVSVRVWRARKKLGRKPRPTAAMIDSKVQRPRRRATAWLRCWKACPRPQAAHRHRYQWPAARRPCSPRQRPGRPWRRTIAEEGADATSPPEPCLCRPGLSGAQQLHALSHCGPWTIEIVERPKGVKGFQLLPRRWVVERTLPGSADVDVSPKTSRLQRPRKSPGYSSPTSGS